jgi:hypothetical protein
LFGVIDLSAVGQWIPVAAIVAAAGAYIFREIEAALSRKRELKGLLRLLAVEIEYNEHILDAFKNSRSHPGEHLESLHTHAWEEIRGRIAQLLKRSEDFGCLADYFMNVANYEEHRRSGQEWEVPLLEYIPSPLPNRLLVPLAVFVDAHVPRLRPLKAVWKLGCLIPCCLFKLPLGKAFCLSKVSTT